MKRITTILLNIISPILVLSHSNEIVNRVMESPDIKTKKSCSTRDKGHLGFDLDLEWKLDDFPEMNDVNKICDPDFILNRVEYDLIAKTMGFLNNIVLQYVPSKNQNSMQNQFIFVTSEKMKEDDIENGESNIESNGTCETETPIEIALVIINKMKIQPYKDEDITANEFAVGLHDKWGVGSTVTLSTQDCLEHKAEESDPHNILNGDTGILFFFSIQDRAVFISRGSALESILTDRRIQRIINHMKPYLRDGLYGKGIQYGMEYVIKILGDNHPVSGNSRIWDSISFLLQEYFEEFTILLMFILHFIHAWWKKRKQREYVNIRSQLSRLDRDQALVLQGRYQCTSCPICLENFEGVENDDHTENVEGDDSASSSFIPTRGSDGLPLKLLRCGHVFDETCWRDYVNAGHGDINLCPICKQDVSGETNSTSESTSNNNHNQTGRQEGNNDNTSNNQNNSNMSDNPNDQASYNYNYNSLNRYYRERNFRLTRLQMRYPRYIARSQLSRWLQSSNSSSLSREFQSMQRQTFTNYERNSHGFRSSSNMSHGRSGGSFASFGGGRSSGGSGGRW